MFKNAQKLLAALSLMILFLPLNALSETPKASLNKRVGKASFYGPRFHGSCCTASGERVNMYDLTAAHPHLPFGTRLVVTNVQNGKKVTVRINDRGPFSGDRIIDLSLGAFEKIAQRRQGIIRVRLKLLNESLVEQIKTPLPSMQRPHIKP